MVEQSQKDKQEVKHGPGWCKLCQQQIPKGEYKDWRVAILKHKWTVHEAEMGAISDGEDVLIPEIMQQIERAGVHSGDSMAVYPGVDLTEYEVKTIVDYAIKIGRGLKIKGLMNIQFDILREGNKSTVYIIETNPRASRTGPLHL